MLSICIPTYNRAIFLERNLKHLLTFSKLDIEVNISNNNSNDATSKVIDKYKKKFKKFNYICTSETVDIQYNFDLVLKLATQKYTFLLPDDDMANENDLILGVGLLENNPGLAAVYGGYNKYNSKNKLIETQQRSKTIEVFSSENAHTLLRRFVRLDLLIYKTDLQKHLTNPHVNFCHLGWQLMGIFLSHGNICITPYTFFNYYSHKNQYSNIQNNDSHFHSLTISDAEILLSGLGGSSNEKIQTLVNYKAIYYQWMMLNSYQNNNLIHSQWAIKKGMLYNQDLFSGFAHEWDQKHIVKAAMQVLNNILIAKPHVQRLLIYSIKKKNLEFLFDLAKKHLKIKPVKVTKAIPVSDFNDQKDFILFFNEFDLESAQCGKSYNSETFIDVINALKLTSDPIKVGPK